MNKHAELPQWERDMEILHHLRKMRSSQQERNSVSKMLDEDKKLKVKFSTRTSPS
ncbi:hypothetical protein [Alicyclobacillus tolerans]|uniref:Uncharacterized protein n=1 Tax=Alicyclobacillus tolerans TaxID=90970 RepID=A0A1M6RTY8_9BACL|nr:hypothetical protein [Alicyclobacillus montanus]SHK35896.1 hypothetical protein SAMN05443507_11298 [Alicyclobacillus montanus]